MKAQPYVLPFVMGRSNYARALTIFHCRYVFVNEAGALQHSHAIFEPYPPNALSFDPRRRRYQKVLQQI